jgi:hypothetical protein
MHGAIARVTVLMQVEGEELVVTGELLLGHLFCPCSGAVWWKQGKRSKRTSCPSTIELSLRPAGFYYDLRKTLLRSWQGSHDGYKGCRLGADRS